MAKILYVGTNGSENPTKSIFPFQWANAAVEAGHQAEIYLFGDATVVMRDAVANSVVPVGWPPLKEILAITIRKNIPIYV
jgi:predicted peroxiredoxin